jgi:hypothetical protein
MTDHGDWVYVISLISDFSQRKGLDKLDYIPQEEQVRPPLGRVRKPALVQFFKVTHDGCGQMVVAVPPEKPDGPFWRLCIAFHYLRPSQTIDGICCHIPLRSSRVSLSALIPDRVIS